MKINIKNILEHEGGESVQTNSRLDVEEVFAEALSAGVSEEADAETGGDADYETAETQEAEEETEKLREEVEAVELSEIQEDVAETDNSGSVQEEAAHIEAEEALAVKDTEAAHDIPILDASEEATAADEAQSRWKEQTPVEEVPAAREPRQHNSGKISGFFKSYGWHAGIAAAFVIIIAVVIIYTTMIPRQVNATINGEKFSFTSKAHTVEGFLDEENIDFCDEDYISVPEEAFIYDGIKFEIRHATDFSVTADGKTKKYKSLANTVEEALKDINMEVGDKDIVTPGMDSLLTEDMNIVIQRVVIKTESLEEDVAFKTVSKEDSTLNEGTTKVVTEGVKGTDKVIYEITYIDGKEASRKEIGRETLKEKVDKVVAKGTRINYNGQSYSRKLVVKAYAYTGGGRTAMGTKARVGEIAVDPSVIPLGTNVYIEGVGPRRAEDTGGNIKGNTIDIYMNTQAECLNWGMRYVTIYIQ